MTDIECKAADEVISEALDDIYYYCKKNDGLYHMDIYADYRDGLSEREACIIAIGKNPYDTLESKMRDFYSYTEYEQKSSLVSELLKYAAEKRGLYPDGASPEEYEYFEQSVEDSVVWDYPTEYFLKQKFCVNIFMDTGDGNYDYTLNSVYPCWYGKFGERINDKSSLLWLARQQGYTKTQLWEELKKGDMSEPKGFLQSCRVELANLPSHMSLVSFFVMMSLKELIELNRCINVQERNGKFFDSSKNPYCGYTILSKDVMAGLYDPWTGAGSVLELELERDVRIPNRLIRSAVPDGFDGYSVRNVYGLCESAWMENGVKKIHTPKDIEKYESMNE